MITITSQADKKDTITTNNIPPGTTFRGKIKSPAGGFLDGLFLKTGPNAVSITNADGTQVFVTSGPIVVRLTPRENGYDVKHATWHFCTEVLNYEPVNIEITIKEITK